MEVYNEADYCAYCHTRFGEQEECYTINDRNYHERCWVYVKRILKLELC